jgi:hypothetical protein
MTNLHDTRSPALLRRVSILSQNRAAKRLYQAKLPAAAKPTGRARRDAKRFGQGSTGENLRSFDEFLEKRFPESWRKAYYLMAIHEHLPRIPKTELRLNGMDQSPGVGKDGPERRAEVRLCTMDAQGQLDAQGGIFREELLWFDDA